MRRGSRVAQTLQGRIRPRLVNGTVEVSVRLAVRGVRYALSAGDVDPANFDAILGRFE